MANNIINLEEEIKTKKDEIVPLDGIIIVAEEPIKIKKRLNKRKRAFYRRDRELNRVAQEKLEQSLNFERG